MLSEKKSLLNKPVQKLIYSKDSSYNFGGAPTGGDPSILSLFKSSSSLANSIKSTDPSSKNHLQSTASLILNKTQSKWNTNSKFQNSIKPKNQINNFSKTQQNFHTFTKPIRADASSNSMDIKIRNIIHDYTNIDVNDYTYGILSNLKSKKRSLNLDAIDDYEFWKKQFTSETENNVKDNINNLKDDLKNTQNEVYSKFLMKDEELVKLIQFDIDNITNFYYDVLKHRDKNIEICLKFIMKLLGDCFKKVNVKIAQLGKQLDEIGFLREEEIQKVTDDKKLYIKNLIDQKNSYYTRIINEIKDSEKELVEQSKKDLNEFILRWKNVKLNHFLDELKKLLQSKEYIDNPERANLIKDLNNSQVEIYNKRNQLIFEKLFKLQFDEITTKGIEIINKNLEDIYSEAEKLFTQHIEKLVKNSEDIQNKSLQAVENFKEEVNSVSYDFTKDNHNEKKYNDYEELNSIDDLIEKEIKPILEKNKEDRTEYIKKLNSYIDEFDEYTNNISQKIISVFLNVGKAFDEHKKNFRRNEKLYK